MKNLKRILILCLCVFTLCSLSGCVQIGNGKKIIRISHAQSETHPEHIGLLKFKEYVEQRLGNKYEIQIFPNELLGSAQKAIELTQTGAIDFVVAGTANLETFADIYEVFSMPYLFTSEEAYHRAMNDVDYMKTVYESTDEAGFRVLTWYNAGTRSFYAKKPINSPADLKGMKMRVQQSPASVNMAKAFGAAASPMSFGEVYTAIQQNVIDGAENNELALTNNKHGEVAKFYSYNRHQMVPDMLIGNLKFLQNLSTEEYQIFEEAALLSTQVEMEEWDKQVEEAKQFAQQQMGVQFIEVDVQPFKDAVADVQQQMLKENENIRDLYNHIQKYNEQAAQGIMPEEHLVILDPAVPEVSQPAESVGTEISQPVVPESAAQGGM
ncbi:MAG: TRAP transporter substrate-binding protein [Candidatus Fimimorpha sp.]